MSQKVNTAGQVKIRLQGLDGKFLAAPTLEAGDVMLYPASGPAVALTATVEGPFVVAPITAGQNNAGTYHVEFADQTDPQEWLGVSIEVCPEVDIERANGPLDNTFKDGDNIEVDVDGVTRTGRHRKV